MKMKQFQRVVLHVMETLPEEFQAYLDNVVVDVEHEPDEETLRALGFTEEEIASGDSLYGLFAPMDLPSSWCGDAVDREDAPHRIIIYKKSLEQDFPECRQLLREIRKTVIHELAHHFGYTDRDLERFDNMDDPFGDGFEELFMEQEPTLRDGKEQPPESPSR